jgi:hypothetical protein
MDSDECDSLVETQLGPIDREVSSRRCSEDTLQTLAQMQTEYRQHLQRSGAGR